LPETDHRQCSFRTRLIERLPTSDPAVHDSFARNVLGSFEKALLAIFLLVVMFGMGAGLTIGHFRDVVRRPFAPIVGFCSQFGWMPLLAYALARVLALPQEQAVALLIVGCVPGGATSNLFTMYARSDVALSVSMTAISTLTSVVVMPVLLSLYGRSLTDASFQIPTGNITGTLAIMLIPLALGMCVRALWPRRAAVLERIGSFAGIGVLVLLVGSGILGNLEHLAHTEGRMFAASFGLGACGFGFGYVGAGLAGLPVVQRRAVALETGIQNSPLVFGIIIATFPVPLHERMLALPLLYALLVLLTASVLTIYWRGRPS